MSNKQLTATLRFETKQAEASLDRIIRKINQINNTVNKTKSSRIEQDLKESDRKLSNIVNKVKSWASSQKEVNSYTRTTNSLLTTTLSKLKSLATTYLGIMGMRTVIDTSDTITSAQNKLNYINAQESGNSAYASDGSGYSQATFDVTQANLGQMYTSSQKVRMGYDDMMNNVSKSMVLAGDSFQNSTDNAIRFQEIMAEAYAIGGASAAEMSSSMYQMIQALGAGTLAGDELRSVREGAPLAYKAIEKFAQGVYNTEESLKELASQGKITSDMVVAAVMNAGEEMDFAFAQTEQTFAQTWTQIKNAAIQAFRPVSDMLREMLNNAVDNGLLNKIEKLFSTVSIVIQIVFKLIQQLFKWIADNWDWLKYLLLGGIILLTLHFLKLFAIVISNSIISIVKFTIMHWKLLAIVEVIVLLIWVFNEWRNEAIDTCEAIAKGLAIVAIMLIFIGIIIGNIPMIVVGVILILGALILNLIEQVFGWTLAVITFIGDAFITILNIAITSVMFILAILGNLIKFIVKSISAVFSFIGAVIYDIVLGVTQGADAIQAYLDAVCENIKLFFSNTWHSIVSDFWWMIGSLLTGIGELEPAFNAIAELFGLEGVTLTGLANDAFDKASSEKNKIKDYVSPKEEFNKIWNNIDFKNPADAAKEGWGITDFNDINGTIDKYRNFFGEGLSDWNFDKYYGIGAAVGGILKENLNSWGEEKRNDVNDFIDKNLSLEALSKKLGLDITDMFPSSTDGAGGSYTIPSNEDLIGENVQNIDDNTSKIADSMDLTNDDLEYLRKIAEMEWRNEFTTAEIKVDMTNNNTVNGERDLDGIVDYLSDVLRAEMTNVAYGVHY